MHFAAERISLDDSAGSEAPRSEWRRMENRTKERVA